MNTGLGISFLRIVNEEGSNGWAQVYARIPFENVELFSKGALFGVVRGTEKEGWAERDMQLMEWVEEYFNKIETEVEIKSFFQEWRDKYPDLAGVWVWVLERDGNREILMSRLGGAGVTLLRKGKEFDFASSLVGERVVRGRMEEGDRVVVWTDELPEKSQEKRLVDLDEEAVSRLSSDLQTNNFAAAGIVLDFQKFEDEATIVVPPEKVETHYPDESRSLADDKYIGPIGTRERILNWWMRVGSRFKKPVYQEGLVERRDGSKRKRIAVMLGVAFLILLLISLVSGSIKIKKESEVRVWKEFSEPIEKSLLEAATLVQLNPSGAKKLVQDAEIAFESGKTVFLNGPRDKDLVVLENNLKTVWTQVSGEKESQLTEVVRIDLVRQGFKGERLGLIKGSRLVALDGDMGVVTTVDLSTKDIKVVAGKGVGLGWLDAIENNNKMMILNSSGVRNSDGGQDLVKFDAAVVKPIALGSFGGSLYVLDQGNKEIFRYAPVGENFGERARWLKQDQAMSVVPVDMAIDGDIWVVSETGQVEKFRRGNEEQFSLTGLTAGMKVSRLAVEVEGDGLALLDGTSGVVAVCSKSTGICSQFLKSEKLREARDLEFDGQGELLVLLPGIIGLLK